MFPIQRLWDSLVTQMVKNPPAMQETQVQSLDHEEPLEKVLATHAITLAWRIPQTEEYPCKIVFLGFPSNSECKESTCNAGDPGSIPGLGKSPGEGNGYPLQYSCLENSMDKGA